MTLGEKISYYRKACGLTQEELADRLSVSRQTIYKWEAGLAKPTLDKLEGLTKILEIDFNILLG